MIELRWVHEGQPVLVRAVLKRRPSIFVHTPLRRTSSTSSTPFLYIESLVLKFPPDDGKMIWIDWGEGFNNFLGASRLKAWMVLDAIKPYFFKNKEGKEGKK